MIRPTLPQKIECNSISNLQRADRGVTIGMNIPLLTVLAASGKSLPLLTKAALIAKLVLLTSSLAVMAIYGVWIRVLQERKFKEMFGANTEIRRIPPFFIVNLSTLPETSAGAAYKEYVKRTSKQYMLVFVIAAAALALGFFLPIGMSRP